MFIKPSSDDVVVEYMLITATGTESRFSVRLDRTSGRLITEDPSDHPEWTRLEHRQCSNCPLSTEDTPWCPAALAIEEVVDRFEPQPSHARCTLRVTDERRTIVNEDVPVQLALRSIMGMLIAASGCPHTAFLRPMARFHLPLSSREETNYRVTTMWLMGEYFRARRGEAADFSMTGLVEAYERLPILNRALADRIRTTAATDAPVNAVVSLDTLAMFVPMAVTSELDEIEGLFLPEPPPVELP